MENKEKTIATTVRIPESLKRDLEQIAARQERSLNNQMLVALREYVRNHAVADDPEQKKNR